VGKKNQACSSSDFGVFDLATSGGRRRRIFCTATLRLSCAVGVGSRPLLRHPPAEANSLAVPVRLDILGEVGPGKPAGIVEGMHFRKPD